MALGVWVAGCANERPLEAELVRSRWVPSAAEVVWDGPAGEASLWVAPSPIGSWRQIAAAAVPAGRSSLPLALVEVGKAWRWRVEVEAASGVWRSPTDTTEPPAPDQVGLDREKDKNEATFPDGYWVGTQYSTPGKPEGALSMVVDGTGALVWWVPPSSGGHRAIRALLGLDGRSVLVLEDHEQPELRQIVRYSLDGSARTVTPTPHASHDFRENPDGTLTLLEYRYSDDERMPRTPGPTVAEALVTGPEGAGGDWTEGFDFFMDYPHDPWFPCGHAGWDLFVPEAAEWTHSNSLVRSPLGDGWLVSVRHLDAVIGVGDDGTFSWQAGGRDATLAPVGPVAFEHAHASDAWLEDGAIHLLVFDNGDHSPAPVVSRAVELRIDPAAGTVEEVWALADPRERHTTFLGDAQRLPGGTTLITWTGGTAGPGTLAEYAADGEELWRLRSDAPLGRGTWVRTLSP